MRVKFTVTCFNGDATRDLLLPGRYVVCSRCSGEGKHSNPAIDSHGISQEEFDDNPGFQEAYMSGVYDISCEVCKGKRVVPELILERLPKALRKRVESTLAEQRDYMAESAHYHRLAAMGIEY